MIYYGDEIGMPGAGDPDNRRFMQWDGLHRRTRRGCAIGSPRSRRSAPRIRPRVAARARRSAWRTTCSSTRWRRAGDAVFVAINRGDTEQPAVNLAAGTYKDLISGATVTVPLTIPARTGLVLAAQ